KDMFNLKNDTLFVAVVNKHTVVASGTKEYVTDAVDRGAGRKKAEVKNAKVKELLKAADGTQTFWVVATGAALAKSELANDENAKEAFAKLESVSGAVNLTADVKLQFVLAAKDADGAKEMDTAINDALDRLKGLLALVAGGQKEMGTLLEVARTVKT